MNRRSLIKKIALGAVTAPFLEKSSWAQEVFAEEDVYKKALRKPNETLWFKEPGRYWNSQALHIGNGALGLSFLGGVHEEIFGITEKTLWTGGPGENAAYQYGIKPGGKDYLTRIRDLITSNETGNLKEADRLVRNHFLGDAKGYGHFSSFGRLSLLCKHSADQYTNYIRSLDLGEAMAAIQYDIDNVTFRREYFCSYPDQVAVLSLSASAANRLSFTLRWNAFQKDHQLVFTNNEWQLSGNINGNKRKFCLKMNIHCTGGTVVAQGNDLVIENATAVTILLAAATEYASVAPLYQGADPAETTRQQIQAAKIKTLSQLKARHRADYRQLYDRIQLSVPPIQAAESLPTNERWKKYAAAGKDPGLKVLYFNVGRYLLISASRPGSLPANLQGGWNMFEAAQWSGNYQSNINVQLNYSSACAVNLLECQQPYIEWIKGLVKPGTAVAQAYYNSEGWVSHSIGNVWGYAAPGFEIEWGMYPAGAAWHCHFVWKHFVYSQNLGYLKDTGYPVLKGAATFWLQNLVPYKGYLVTAPSGSAEHGVYISNGQLLATGSSFDQDILNVPGNFQDIQMVHELFTNTIAAAQVLKTDAALVASLQEARSKLLPLKTGRLGQLQEWADDVDTPECNHRHIGHLYALWPAKQITATTTELAEAAKKTLDLRGEERNYKSLPHKDIYTAANWSLGLRLACWLRLQDAERANKLFTQIITQAGFENILTFQHIPIPEQAAKKQPDLEFFNTPEGYWYPVWQVDASLAIPGFIAEMLLQCNRQGHLLLLPALPGEWPEGKVRGLKAEGNFTVDLEWKQGTITKYRISSPVPAKVTIHINGAVKVITTKNS